MTLGEYIRLYRAEHGLSQREFVERCGGGITHGYVSIIEKGVNPNTGKASRPSLDKLYAIARGMGMSVSDLAKKVDDFGDAASIVAESTVPPRPANALPYTPSRAMVAVVGSVRCGPPNAAYPNTYPCRAGVRDKRQQESPGVMPGRFSFLAGSDVSARLYPVILIRLMLIYEPVASDFLGGGEPAAECLLANDHRVFVMTLGVFFQRDQGHCAITSQ